MAKSIAVWIGEQGESKNNNEDRSEIELHFNYWKLSPTESKNNLFLDIGVKFKNLQNDLNIYLPFTFSNSEFIDLGDKLSNAADVISTIFNDSIIVDTNPINRNNYFTFYSVEKPQTVIKWLTNISIQDSENNEKKAVTKKISDEGTTINFPIHEYKFEKDEYGYFRFRVYIDNLRGSCKIGNYV